ncbi:scavenger receptor cysteine-rich domain-containing protein DMBT1-like [Clavelina lepadiformis]|uniref:CUB domain-containing protein n=1 Tax=Clavelina lepadiformis TaxID=159417 RepID=A0ABP0GTF4_CLALP
MWLWKAEIIVLTCFHLAFAEENEVLIIGLFPEPFYEKGDFQTKYRHLQFLQTSVRNAGTTPIDIGFHAYLPDKADKKSFSLRFQGKLFYGKKGNKDTAQEVMKRAVSEDHNAAIYIPRSISDVYNNGQFQADENTIHIKGGHELIFEVKYENPVVTDVLQNDKRIPNGVHVSVDLYETTAENIAIEISSPNYPNDYPNNANVTWWIRVPEDKTVVIDITELEMENFDRLTVYDGVNDDIIAQINETIDTGRINSGQRFQSTKNSVLLRLTSDGLETSRGFKALVRATSPAVITTTKPENTRTKKVTSTTVVDIPSSACRGTTNLYTDGHQQLTFSSPGYPISYPNNVDYSWRIVSLNSDHVIAVTVLDIELESCCDLVLVYDGYSSAFTLLANLGNNSTKTVFSSKNYIFINFVTDISVTQKGFTLQYESLICAPVQELYAYPHNVNILYSAGYPNSYYNSMNCTWLIYSPYPEFVIKLTVIDIQLESCCDHLYIYDGNDADDLLLAELGSEDYGTFYSSDVYLFLNFLTDDSTTGKGFLLNYTTSYSSETVCSSSEHIDL